MRHPDPQRLAADARSILACPASASLVVEGEPNANEDRLELCDDGGTPALYCPPDSPVARAAVLRSSALLTLGSGLGPRGGAERGDTLTLGGRLEPTPGEAIVLHLNFVLLARDGRQHRVPLAEFRSPAHRMNRGHLQRSTEHANDCHQDELRNAVSLGTGTRPAEIIGVQISGLCAESVEVQWVDDRGAHQQLLRFPRPAHDIADLGELLRRGLYAGLRT